MGSRLVPPVTAPPPELAALRTQVRDFLHQQIAQGVFTPGVDTWLTRWDEDFTRALAAQGWVGMTIPTEYGGHGRTFLHRFVVTEELLAVGAPVAAHWVADRQIAPTLLRFGTEAQKRRFLPAIARGECYFGIGMSEPDSGSDLASVRTRAVRVDGGWRLTGTKVWTSGAHRAHAFFALARSAPLDTADRHAGLSQFIVDLRGPGVTVRPITSMNGAHHFNEVFLDDVFVPDDLVLGEVGAGWRQVNSELGYERSGPERFLSTVPLLAETVAGMRAGLLPRHTDAGRYVARLAGLHQMSLAVSGALERGEPADTAAALVKLLGTATEGDIAEYADQLSGDGTELPERFTALLAAGLLQRPGFTLRGGTNEILRGVIARGLGMRR
ncbi:acyl-CoA dehydrogenase family protein [Micromonospora sp. NPDC047074]|uniref:acyl-CoA dehydrogenase family protein n=1 Tax=Micromonospora sp. NPDC047074 TaxID=3154339 RepID=UPI0033DA0A35